MNLTTQPEMHSLEVLEVQSPKAASLGRDQGVRWAAVPPKNSRGESVLCLSQLLVAAGFPGFPEAPSHPHSHFHVASPVCVFPLTMSQEHTVMAVKIRVRQFRKISASGDL